MADRGAPGVRRAPGQLTWVVVGDLSQIEEPVRALGFGEVRVLEDEPAESIAASD